MNAPVPNLRDVLAAIALDAGKLPGDFWGEVTIKVQAGSPVVVELRQTYRPTDLSPEGVTAT